MLKILTCITKNTTFSDGYFCPAFFPNKNAPIATAIITITITATISSIVSDESGCCDCEVEGDELGAVLDVGVGVDIVVGDGLGDCVEAGVGIGTFRLGA